jgi:hypothetical protein
MVASRSSDSAERNRALDTMARRGEAVCKYAVPDEEPRREARLVRESSQKELGF